MPAPNAQQLEPIALSAMKSAGLKGDNAPNLGRALAKTIADAFALFMAQAQVMPGIPASAPPPSGSGSTTGTGTLMPPPAGGPTAAQIEPLATAALSAEGIMGNAQPALAKVIAGAVAQGIVLFTGQVTVAPGIAIAGLVTTSPGTLL